LRPGDLVTAASVIVAGVGVLFGFLQFRDAVSQEARATQEAARQNEEIAQQDENNEPLLIPATPPAERGFVKTAGDVARDLPTRLARPAGTYVVRSGEADQFGFFQPSIRGGHLAHGGWYSFDYQRWGASQMARPRGRGPAYTPFGYESNINVLVWYSDGARSKLRWSCAEYIFAGIGRGGLEYAVTGQTFGEAGKPPASAPTDKGPQESEWARLGSNQRPLACEASALPLSYAPGSE
jgi:hypothetical protein